MTFPTRNRETIYADYIFRYHPDFAGLITRYSDRTSAFHIEGGDILNLSDTVLGIGISQRTTPDAIEQIARKIFEDETSTIRTVLAFKIPVSRAFMTLEDIASLTGFADASHLTKRFIEQTGIKPAEYRRIYRKANPTFGKTDKELAYRITDYIYNHFATEKFKQEAVAEHFGISVNELNRSLLYYTGKSFENLLNFIRVNKAAEKLISTDETIMDKEEMLAALHQAQQGGEPFDAERYINRFPARKHGFLERRRVRKRMHCRWPLLPAYQRKRRHRALCVHSLC